LPQQFIAIIGDLVKSRELPDRSAVQDKLRTALEQVNKHFGVGIRSRFVVTVGDEFQGLVAPGFPVDEFWWFYNGLMRPNVATRFGFGVGELATELLPEAVGMDGPCFYAARQAIERARSEKRSFCFSIDGDPAASEALNEASLLVCRVMEDWTPVQWETVSLFAQLGEKARVAEQRGVTKQSVDDVLKSSRGEDCITTLHGVSTLFGKLISQADPPDRTKSQADPPD
jgi:hypothetical protein